MDSYEKIGGIADHKSEGLFLWIVSLDLIILYAAITIALLWKQFFRRK
jgi:hypothetical protein